MEKINKDSLFLPFFPLRGTTLHHPYGYTHQDGQIYAIITYVIAVFASGGKGGKKPNAIGV